MAINRKPINPERQAQILDKIRRDAAIRQKSYREQALRLHPHICTSCKREFSGKRLSELTVHHRDHNHDNNPPDGSNWELLCIYCHDNEHEKIRLEGHFTGTGTKEVEKTTPLFSPFDNLDQLLGGSGDEEKK